MKTGLNQEIKISGESMLPQFKSGDTLCFTMGATARQGDICLIKDSKSKELIVHRLVSEAPLTFKGDNSLNIEQGEQYTLLGVSLESRGKLNKTIAQISIHYQFKVNRIKRVFCKILMRVISA